MECQICYDACKYLKKTKCNHCFCKSCYDKWTEMHNTCPMCRKKILFVKTDKQCYDKWYKWKCNSYEELIEKCFEDYEEEIVMHVYNSHQNYLLSSSI